jgi:hypothetical protein
MIGLPARRKGIVHPGTNLPKDFVNLWARNRIRSSLNRLRLYGHFLNSFHRGFHRAFLRLGVMTSRGARV